VAPDCAQPDELAHENAVADLVKIGTGARSQIHTVHCTLYTVHIRQLWNGNSSRGGLQISHRGGPRAAARSTRRGGGSRVGITMAQIQPSFIAGVWTSGPDGAVSTRSQCTSTCTRPSSSLLALVEGRVLPSCLFLLATVTTCGISVPVHKQQQARHPLVPPSNGTKSAPLFDPECQPVRGIPCTYDT
jgi:hypothetical protein